MFIFKKEKQVAKLLIAHAEAMEACLDVARQVLARYLDGDLAGARELADQVDAHESAADEMLKDIRDRLYSGAFLPSIREDIHQLVASVDRVANAAEDCSDQIVNQVPEIPENLHDRFRALADASFSVGKPLRKALAAYFRPKGKIDDLRAQAGRVEKSESQSDSLEAGLTRAIFESKLEFARKLHLQRMVEAIVEVSDRAENATDRLHLTSLKSVV